MPISAVVTILRSVFPFLAPRIAPPTTHDEARRIIESRLARDCTEADAAGIVAEYTRVPISLLSTHEVEGFPEFFYVVEVDSKGGSLIGGPAYIVVRETGEVHEVSASVPARHNCKDIRATLRQRQGPKAAG